MVDSIQEGNQTLMQTSNLKSSSSSQTQESNTQRFEGNQPKLPITEVNFLSL